jgi:ABC-2 type transport system permease protein
VIDVPEVDYFDNVLLGLLGLGIMMNSIISIAVRISTFRNQSILKRLLVTPLPIWKFFAAEITAHVLLALVQAGIILSLGVFVFGGHVYGNIFWVLAITALGSVVFLNIGFILSAWAKSPAAASGMGNAVAMPMMFLGGAFFSTAALPWVLPEVAQALPLTPMLVALREVAIESEPIWETWPYLAAMGAWVVVTAAGAVKVFKFS